MDTQIEAKESDIRCLTEQELDTIAAGAVHLALQLLFLRGSESMGNHDSKIVDAASVD